jgi:hypothetical protein
MEWEQGVQAGFIGRVRGRAEGRPPDRTKGPNSDNYNWPWGHDFSDNPLKKDMAR